MPASSPAQQKEDNRQRIVSAARQMFFDRGIRSVTMDDIAHRLRMSKRTLYQIFADKEELLLACCRQNQQEHRLRVEKLAASTDNVLEIILGIFEYNLNASRHISPAYFTDLPRYEQVMTFMQQQRQMQRQQAVDFLQKGIEQGLFRTDLDFDLVFQFSHGLSDFILRGKFLDHHTATEVFMASFFIFLRGCTTEKGRAAIDQFCAAHLQTL